MDLVEVTWGNEVQGCCPCEKQKLLEGYYVIGDMRSIRMRKTVNMSKGWGVQNGCHTSIEMETRLTCKKE